MTELTKTQAVATAKRYESVTALVAGEGLSNEVREKLAELKSQSNVVLRLAKLRQAAGITQEEMANHMNVTQSAISKLESGTDGDLRLCEIAAYSKITSQNIGIGFGKPLNHVQCIRNHAFAIRAHFDELAKLAHQDADMEKSIQAFFGEAFFNILDILAECGDKLPSGPDFEVTVDITGPKHRVLPTAFNVQCASHRKAVMA
jgi:transcriptional regulator with XRE-family HTH domain